MRMRSTRAVGATGPAASVCRPPADWAGLGRCTQECRRECGRLTQSAGRSWAARFMRLRAHSRISTRAILTLTDQAGDRSLVPGRCGDWCSGPTGHLSGGAGRPQDRSLLTRLIRAGMRLRPGIGARLVAAPWRLPEDPVRSNRHADAAAAVGHQGVPGARHGARVAVGGRIRLLGRGQLRGPVGCGPLTARCRAGRSAGSCPSATALRPAPEPERTAATGAARRAGRRMRGRARGRRGTASGRFGPGPVAGPMLAP
jgi:hypothetical protein